MLGLANPSKQRTNFHVQMFCFFIRTFTFEGRFVGGDVFVGGNVFVEGLLLVVMVQQYKM